METQVATLTPDAVIYRDVQEQIFARANDSMFIFAGGELPNKFLEACGIAIDTKFGQP